jgi:hypothetical protein
MLASTLPRSIRRGVVVRGGAKASRDCVASAFRGRDGLRWRHERAGLEPLGELVHERRRFHDAQLRAVRAKKLRLVSEELGDVEVDSTLSGRADFDDPATSLRQVNRHLEPPTASYTTSTPPVISRTRDRSPFNHHAARLGRALGSSSGPCNGADDPSHWQSPLPLQLPLQHSPLAPQSALDALQHVFAAPQVVPLQQSAFELHAPVAFEQPQFEVALLQTAPQQSAVTPQCTPSARQPHVLTVLHFGVGKGPLPQQSMSRVQPVPSTPQPHLPLEASQTPL